MLPAAMGGWIYKKIIYSLDPEPLRVRKISLLIALRAGLSSRAIADSRSMIVDYR